MKNAVKGHYNGSHIVMDENICLSKGQQVIISILDVPEDVPAKKYDLSRYMGRGEKMFHSDAQSCVKELRENDRI